MHSKCFKRLKAIVPDSSRGDLAIFLLSLLLAFAIWLIHMCSLSYTDIVTVPVIASSNIEGYSALSTNQGDIAATCHMTGFRLISASRSGRKPITVNFNASDFVKTADGVFTISSAKLNGYVKDIFGEGSSVSSFVTPEVQFRFSPETYVKVPIQAVCSFDFKPQFTAVGEIKLKPDSVVVYGTPSVLENIDRISTVPLLKSKVGSSVHGTLKLEAPLGVRISESQVNYSLEVSRFVEIKTSVKVQPKNVPAGKSLTIVPSTAEATFRCIFPTNSDPTNSVRFYVDYADFSTSLSGKCIAHPDKLPEGVIDYNLEPQVFECIENF